MATIDVSDDGQRLSFSFEEMLRYSGPGSPAGVAMAFKAMELAFALVSPGGPPERRQVVIETAFRGPGARDGFELVTRGLTEGRYHVRAALERAERGRTLEQFVFCIRYQDHAVTLLVRPGRVTDEFITLARTDDRSPDQEQRFTDLKRDLAGQLLASRGDEVFEVES